MNFEQTIKQLNENIANRSVRRPQEHNLREETMDLQFSRRRFDESSLLTSASIYGSQTNVSVIVKQKTDHLYQHFLSVIQSRSNELEVFEIVADLRQVLQNTIDEMQSSKNVKVDNETWIRQEMNTWSLIHCLYKDRLITQKEQEMETDNLPLMNSEKIIVERLYLNNATLREHQLILDWLEQTASEKHTIQVAHYADRSSMAWENTLHQLQNVGRTIFSGHREIVKSLDIDAPHREQFPLHDLDMEDQKRLTRHLFNAIRQGKVDEAQRLSEHCGQPWQAALFEGWRLFHDPNLVTNEADKDSKHPIEGNPRRDLWKRCAYAMANSLKLDNYTRAIAASFCGSLEPMTDVLGDDWYDLLWAHLKVQIDIRVESEIRSTCSKPYCAMPEKYWDGKISMEQIFAELDANKNLIVKSTGRSTMAIIQKLLILDDISGLMEHMNCRFDSEDTTPQILRFFAHLVMFIRQIGRNHQEDIGDKIIRSYVQCLMKLGDSQLVAFYTAALPSAQQVHIYSEFIENVHDSLRRQCLEEGQSCGLDIALIAKITVERIQNLTEESTERQQTNELSLIDVKKIASLELLNYSQEQRGEMLWQGNAMMRNFLALRKIQAVKKTFEAIPSDSIQVLCQFYGGKNNLPISVESAVCEYLCHQTYIVAIDGYNDWIALFHNKPKPPAAMQGQNFSEKVAVEHQEHLFQQYLVRWKQTLSEQTQLTKSLLYNVLLFPERGWLVDSHESEHNSTSTSDAEVNMWQNRKIQMENLRRIHIPDTTLLLHKILTLAEEHQECIKLCDEIAAEQNELIGVFSKHKMSEFLGKVAESSLILMNQNFDSFGYAPVN